MNNLLAVKVQNANGHFWPTVVEGSNVIFNTSSLAEASMEVYIDGIRSLVRYSSSANADGVINLSGAVVGELTLEETIEQLGPSLLRRSVTITASTAASYYLALTYYPTIPGQYCSYSEPDPVPTTHQQQTDALFPMVGILSGGMVYGAFMGAAAFTGNQGFQQIDPIARVVKLQNGDARAASQEGSPDRTVLFNFSQAIAAHEVQTWVTYIFRSPARNQYEVQLAAHLALANAKGWNGSAVEAVTRTTSYLLLRENLLEWGNRCSVIMMSGIGYGWKQWADDVFWNYLALGEPLDIGQSSFNGLFRDRLRYEDNALLYMIFACLLVRAGGTVNRNLMDMAYTFIRGLEKDGAYLPNRVVFQADAPSDRHFNYRTYFDYMFYEDGDAPSSNQGFFCLALVAAKELGYPVSDREISNAANVYQSMFNPAEGFLATSQRRPSIVSQDGLMGEVLAYTLFGCTFLTNAIVHQHVLTVDAGKTANGLKIFCHGDGSYLNPAEYGLPGFPNTFMIPPTRQRGDYESGGSWFLCDALTYLAGTIHGLDTEAQQLWRIKREIRDTPSFKEWIGTASGQDGGNALYGWNGAYVYLRQLVRKRLGLPKTDPMFAQIDTALGVQHLNSQLMLNPSNWSIPKLGPSGEPSRETLPPIRELPTAPGWTLIDDADSRVHYVADAGSWKTDSDPNLIKSTQHYTYFVGNYCSLEFTGSRVTVIYYTAPGMGLLEISIDGRSIKTIDCHSPNVSYQQEWAYGELDGGSHTITVRHGGQGISPSPDTYIAIDAFTVPSVKEVDDSSPSITYTVEGGATGWHTDPDPHLINGTQHYTHGVRNSASLEFVGDFVEVVYYVAPNMGLMEIILDGGVIDIIDCHSLTTKYQVVQRYSGFGMGLHSAAVRHGGRGSAPTPDTYIAIDAFRYSNLG